MNDSKWERLGATSGLAAFVVGAVGGALERGWPSATDPRAVAAFIADHRGAILGQSMAFLLSSAIYVWFLGTLRSYLMRFEAGSARLATTAFGAGIAWAAVGMIAQAFQVGMAIAPSAEPPPAVLLWTMSATFGIANLPLAVMLIATAVVALRWKAFPAWLGGIALVAAAAQLLLWTGAVVDRGPLAPNGWLTYTLYPVFAIWLVPTAIVMMTHNGTVLMHAVVAAPTVSGPGHDAGPGQEKRAAR